MDNTKREEFEEACKKEKNHMVMTKITTYVKTSPT